ncbi:hypothetical protein EG68_10776 [Paragonimus skrjabini miyazakii]|uniref:Uncharacterized protein n=1 Tax=Paragonimus skrjabini miyazakii TaxID=59628 RepID=A0A8S9YIW3_9TREM|nr:hypothetical protein EG68_10776 [Paragonimus skrjabini miyazakii]
MVRRMMKKTIAMITTGSGSKKNSGPGRVSRKKLKLHILYKIVLPVSQILLLTFVGIQRLQARFPRRLRKSYLLMYRLNSMLTYATATWLVSPYRYPPPCDTVPPYRIPLTLCTL